MFLYLVLVTLGHGITAALPLIRRNTRKRPLWRAAWSWVAAAGITVAALTPLALTSSEQSAQIDWIQHISTHTVQEVLLTQWFTKNPAFAVFGCVVASGGALLALRSDRGRSLVAVALPWAVVPTVVLIVASLVTNPLYSPRYVAFGAPAAALCMGAAVTVVPDRVVRRVIAAAVIVAAALSAPTWVQQRTVTAKDDSAWNQVAALIRSERAKEPAGQDDAIVYGPLERHPLATSRIIEETYPAAFAGIRDPLLESPAVRADGLWETQRPLTDLPGTIGNAKSVWLLTAVSPDERNTVTKQLAAVGYHPDGTWQKARTWVIRYSR
ncbi:hypothetical protein [Curtobacterium sp. ISL-83]|uniref:hypothetical protein n=1 Tax=Curtobacterium sp. ISL-83 TaxID=2819145 RepID=UPI001BE8BDE4|nr:hypothetical protein [Curtobacterium sp. ISL-83]MBT2504093.1 hypothetical protein [Curtobacterium sp. ISL-83]